MTETELKQGFYAGEWEVQPLHNHIAGPEGEEHLEPKVMDLLLILAERPPQPLHRSRAVGAPHHQLEPQHHGQKHEQVIPQKPGNLTVQPRDGGEQELSSTQFQA